MNGPLTTIRTFLQSFSPVIPRVVISIQNIFIVGAIKLEVFLSSPINDRIPLSAVIPAAVLLNETGQVYVMV